MYNISPNLDEANIICRNKGELAVDLNSIVTAYPKPIKPIEVAVEIGPNKNVYNGHVWGNYGYNIDELPKQPKIFYNINKTPATPVEFIEVSFNHPVRYHTLDIPGLISIRPMPYIWGEEIINGTCVANMLVTTNYGVTDWVFLYHLFGLNEKTSMNLWKGRPDIPIDQTWLSKFLAYETVKVVSTKFLEGLFNKDYIKAISDKIGI